MPINPKELNIEELKNRIKWLEKGLKDIKGWTRETEIQDVAQAILDGEPTTADEYNEYNVVFNLGDDVEYNYTSALKMVKKNNKIKEALITQDTVYLTMEYKS